MLSRSLQIEVLKGVQNRKKKRVQNHKKARKNARAQFGKKIIMQNRAQHRAPSIRRRTSAAKRTRDMSRESRMTSSSA
jgi:hypothetical protein